MNTFYRIPNPDKIDIYITILTSSAALSWVEFIYEDMTSFSCMKKKNSADNFFDGTVKRIMGSKEIWGLCNEVTDNLCKYCFKTISNVIYICIGEISEVWSSSAVLRSTFPLLVVSGITIRRTKDKGI